MAAQLVVCDFTVTSLDEKLVYEFRVSAQNQVGMSLPCDLKGAVIPKDILGEDYKKISVKGIFILLIVFKATKNTKT